MTDDRDRLESKVDRLDERVAGLETKLDRLVLLVGALLVVQLAHVVGGDILLNLLLVLLALGLLGFAAVFLLALGKRL
ncbi:hypothetical protein M0R88_08265 [Halorussus gelatinilyticus]|uniref:Uncharacterized protein n=1 Tax=Halorussus gelatinilyticus TaxID=2937524 RepID=A0A8U0INC9_9EURY|nr:hypothetical protein [Halorussus gelatinilyticus]UPW02076.1 hypothetical protein M0R88_08265 [Halorussus gelatinilyticus]